MIEIKIGDCVQRLKDLESNSVDSIISDPPYGLKYMEKGWDDLGQGSQQREWHRGWLEEAYRVLKPNGVVKAFSGSRTFHNLISMMGEIGFSDLSVEAWVYGSGFPKSLNVSKAIDANLGVSHLRPVVGEQKLGGTARKIKGGKRHGCAMVGTDIERQETVVELSDPYSEEAKVWEGWGTALKPAWEPICIGYKR